MFVQRDRPLVLVSGGEPLAQPACQDLLAALVQTGRIIQLETSGAFDISGIPKGVRRILDVKTPDSGECEANLESNFGGLRDGDEIKFVITSQADYHWARDWLRQHGLSDLGLPVLFSPAWGELAAEQLAAWILEDGLPVRLHLQQHKHIWGGEAKGV